jgi:hypothetical protein
VPNMGFPFGGSFVPSFGYQMNIGLVHNGVNVPMGNYMSGNMAHSRMLAPSSSNHNYISIT